MKSDWIEKVWSIVADGPVTEELRRVWGQVREHLLLARG